MHTKILETWVKQYTSDLFNWAYYKTSDYQSAEDLVQETFLVAAEKMHNFRNESQPRTWLFGILKNKIAEYFRIKSKTPQVHPNNKESFDRFFNMSDGWNKESLPHEWNFSEEQLFDNTDFNQIFEQCMKKLPVQWFACISMKYLEEKNPKIVCQELEISTTNYWQIIHRAKLQLRECLEHHWFNKQR
ncbi:MAG: sigma-70 family RNA polymerase sigma factor [Bacteroidota bacterium]